MAEETKPTRYHRQWAKLEHDLQECGIYYDRLRQRNGQTIQVDGIGFISLSALMRIIKDWYQRDEDRRRSFEKHRREKEGV